MLTQGSDDHGVSHTSANTSREKSRRKHADREKSRTDVKILWISIPNADNPDREDIEKRGTVGVVTSMSLQRVIDRCSFVELMLKRLYRRVMNKDEDTQSRPL